MAKLETELTAAQAEIAEWRILNGWGGTPEIINDFIKGQQTRIHYAQNLDEELTAVTEQRDRLAVALWNMLNQEHGSAVKAGILLRSLNLQYLNPNA